MKPYVNKKITKNLIIIFVIVLITNSLLPNFVQAKTDTESGGGLLAPLEQFVVFLCDKVMEWLQNTFTSLDALEVYDGVYEFKYSPAIIFSGKVPALDINFIEPNVKDTEHIKLDPILEKIINKGMCYNKELVLYFDLSFTEGPSKSNLQDPDDFFEVDSGEVCTKDLFRDFNFRYEAAWKARSPEADGDDEYSLWSQNWELAKKFRDPEYAGKDQSYIAFWYYINEETGKTELYQLEWIDRNGWSFTDNDIKVWKFSDTVVDECFDINDVEYETVVLYESTAKKLQNTIATWYKALRRIALVGLLSVLVYIGIRMVMCSASQEKSKYKKMMVDWLAALCLLFTLHYIMSITLTITQEISNVFETGESDVLLNKLRSEVRRGSSWGEVLAKTIMYVVLVIYTVTFTFRYIKRVIYMAFYTLIAPLITLTYPLDKIKDGQAQAFNMWIKEYVFTALIQVVHLVIYSVLVGSAIELVDNYELYAIIVIMFIKQAEDTIKKMFGFDKSETVGTLGAAATGGLLMSAINKMKTPPRVPGGKGGGASGGASKNVRTASNSNVFASLQAGGAPNAPAPSTPAPSTPAPNAPAPSTQTPSTQTPSTQTPSTQTPSTQTPSTPTQSSSKPKRKIGRGIWKVAGRYTRPIVSKGAGLLGGGAGAMVGFAAGVAQGDFSAAATGLLAGGKAGYYTGQKGVNGIANIKNVRQHVENFTDTWREGAYGEENAQNIKFDREFRKSSAYKELKSQWKDDKNFDDNIQAMLDAGITEKKAMEKVLKNNNNNIADAIGYYTLAKKCPDSVYYDDNKLQQYLEDLGLSQTDANTMRQNMKKYR